MHHELVVLVVLVTLTWGCRDTESRSHDPQDATWRRIDVHEEEDSIAEASKNTPVYDTSKRYTLSTRSSGGHHGGHHGGYGSTPVITLKPNKLSITCTVKDPLEHIIWLRARCPDEYDKGDVVAKASVSLLPSLYSVSTSGEDGSYTSTLEILKPREQGSGGVFRCEAWPHPGHGRHRRVARSAPDPWNAIILGGMEMIEECFYGSHNEKWRRFRAISEGTFPNRQGRGEVKGTGTYVPVPLSSKATFSEYKAPQVSPPNVPHWNK